MPILDSSNSAANKDMMSKIWTYGDTIFYCGKSRNCSLQAISHDVFKSCLVLMHQNEYLLSKGLNG